QRVHPDLLRPLDVEAVERDEADRARGGCPAQVPAAQPEKQREVQNAEQRGRIPHGVLALADQARPVMEEGVVQRRVHVGRGAHRHVAQGQAGHDDRERLVPPDVVVGDAVGADRQPGQQDEADRERSPHGATTKLATLRKSAPLSVPRRSPVSSRYRPTISFTGPATPGGTTTWYASSTSSPGSHSEVGNRPPSGCASPLATS